jgi:hypothetical protein
MADKVLAYRHLFHTASEAIGDGVVMDVGGIAGVGVQVEGITTATVVFEGTIDGVEWYAVQAQNCTDGSVSTSTSADGLFLVPVSGYDQLRCRISAYTAGTLAVTGKGVLHTAAVNLADIDIAGVESVTVDNAAASGVYVRPGTSAEFAVSAASGKIASGAVADGALVTLGAKADAASTSTDTTAITAMQVLKQVSKSVQAVDNKMQTGTDIGDVTVNNAADAGVYVRAGTSATWAVTSAALGDGPDVDSYNSAVIDLAASTANQSIIAAPGANKQLWIYSLQFTFDTAAGTVVFHDSTPTAKSGTMAFSDEGGISVPSSGNFAMPAMKCATNTAFQADTGAGTVDGWITYAVIST